MVSLFLFSFFLDKRKKLNIIISSQQEDFKISWSGFDAHVVSEVVQPTETVARRVSLIGGSFSVLVFWGKIKQIQLPFFHKTNIISLETVMFSVWEHLKVVLDMGQV